MYLSTICTFYLYYGAVRFKLEAHMCITCVYFIIPIEYFLKILHVCRHLYDNFTYTACTLIAVIAMSNSKLHHEYSRTVDTCAFITHTQAI